MAMDPADLFMLRRGLVEAGMDEVAAEKVAVALEGAMALTLEQVLQKWSMKVEHDIAGLRTEIRADVEIAKRDLKLWLFGAAVAFAVTTVTLLLTGAKFLF